MTILTTKNPAYINASIKYYPLMYLPCGGTASFDIESGISYRCETCWSVVGSIGMSDSCREEMKKWDAYKKAGMWEWNYETGESTPLHKK